MESLAAADALGRSLEELKDLLGVTEAGERSAFEERSERWAFRNSGLATKLVDGRVASVFLYADGYEGFAGYRARIAFSFFRVSSSGLRVTPTLAYFFARDASSRASSAHRAQLT